MDILQTDKNLKRMPYRLPESYFTDLTERLEEKRHENPVVTPDHRTLWQILAPYAAMAAMFTIIALGGKALAGIAGHQNEWTDQEEFIYTELMPVTGPSGQFYETSSNEYIAGASDNDIIEYLIYSGVSIEEINFDDYE